MRVRSAYGALLTLISPPYPMRDYGGRVMAAMLLFSSPARHEHIAGDEPALQHEREVVGPASRIAAGALRIDWAAISELTVGPGMRMRKVTRGFAIGRQPHARGKGAR